MLENFEQNMSDAQKAEVKAQEEFAALKSTNPFFLCFWTRLVVVFIPNASPQTVSS